MITKITMITKIMNSKLCLAISMLLLAACSSYEVGDYYSKDNVKGIVLAVDAEGTPTMLLSVDEAANLDVDSAARWVASLGDTAWHMPSKDEMAIARKSRSLINITLDHKGLPAFLKNHTFYWTSTPCSESHSYACGPYGLQCYFNSNKSTHYRARAVRNL